MGILTDGGKTMKTKRQNEIIRLITNGDIETQEELASELRTLGYKVTQATVSRDIRELRLIKVAAKDGGFKYKIWWSCRILPPGPKHHMVTILRT